MPLPGPRKLLPHRPTMGLLVDVNPPGQLFCLDVHLKFMNVSIQTHILKNYWRSMYVYLPAHTDATQMTSICHNA